MSDECDTGLVHMFESLGPDSKDCFRMFARSGSVPGCYVLGWWADFAARMYIKSSSVLKKWNGSNGLMIDAVVVNDTMCKEMIRDCLLRRGASVEFYERAPGGGAYTCVQRGSPGNITDFETTLFEFEEAEIQLMASGALVLHGSAGGNSNGTRASGGAGDGGVSAGGLRVGFASLNTTLRQLTYSEYLDTYQLVSLDVLVAQTNLKHLTLCGASHVDNAAEEGEALRTVRRICERAGVNLTTMSAQDLRQSQRVSGGSQPTLDSLKDLLRVPEERHALTECRLASQALEHMLGSIDIMDGTNQHAYYLRRVVPSTYMKLDTAAIEALSIVSKKPEPRGTLPLSLFTWLNRCHTGMGTRAMRQWLLQPLRNVEDINQRLSMVDIFVHNPGLRDLFISKVLRKCNDMDRLNRKLQRRTLALKDTQAFLNFVDTVPDALQVLRTYNGQDAKLLADEYIAPLEDIHEHMGNLRTLIESTVDFSDRSMVRMNASFDDELQALHEQILSVQKDMQKEYKEVLRKYSWDEKQLKHEYHQTYGYVFRVSRKEDREVRTSKELIIVSTSKDGVRFASEKMASLSDQCRRINEDYDKRQQDLKRKLIDTIASYLPVLDDTKELIAELDVFVAWSLVVKDSPRPMVRPIVKAAVPETSEAVVKMEKDNHSGGRSSSIEDNGRAPLIALKNVRHPLVELRQPDYVPNSLHLSSTNNGLIITGPNMGGKSTYMRSVGIAVVLAQAGCFVPADAAELQVRDAVMCRVGATDHLAQGVSTFMVEMLESAAILSTATNESLAIVDELGRGTSTYDGFGLAWAIAQDIAARIRAALLFSTHFHELTQLPSECHNVRNAHFGADVNEAAGTLRFSYTLEPGPCGQSYGLYVASLAHMPEEVVQNAKEKAAELETFDTNSHNGHTAATEMDEETSQRVMGYAKRIRELQSESADEVAAKRLRDEIRSDETVCSLVTA